MTAKITYKDGNTITTSINGNAETINNYFKPGKYFNIGSVEDNMQQVERCEIIIIPTTARPLSSQLIELTGDSFNAIDFENEDGSPLKSSGVIKHKKTGYLFRVV
jgi:hypothetical protein